MAQLPSLGFLKLGSSTTDTGSCVGATLGSDGCARSSLQNPRLGPPTDVPIVLTQRRSEGEPEQQRQKRDPPRDVASFTRPEEAMARLDELINQLAGQYETRHASMRPTMQANRDESMKFVDQWRRSLCDNMNDKRKAYNEDYLQIKREIYKEHQKQIAIVKLAEAPGRKVENAPGPGVREEPELPALLHRKPDDKKNYWDYVQKGEWRMLNSQAEEITKLQNEIERRIRIANDDKTWKEAVARFINTLRRIKDYPKLTEVIERVVDAVYGFVRNHSVASNQLYNIVILGEAGTGKTRLARIIGSIFSQLGMYVHEELVEATAGDFIGQHLGETAQKSKEFLTRNLERVVFLDEAYALTVWTDEHKKLSQYSKEAVDVLVPFLSNNAGKMAFIVAGYEKEMSEDFFASNQGLKRRFTVRATLENYGADMLFKIYLRSLSETYVGGEPLDANRAEHLAWEQKVCEQQAALSDMFTEKAWLLFRDVTRATKGTSHRWLSKLFAAQAGAMTNMAGVTATLILATNQNPAESHADHKAMFNIILTFIQSVFTGRDENGYPETELAREDLMRALENAEWMEQGQGKNGVLVWSDPGPSLKEADDCGSRKDGPCDDARGKCTLTLTTPEQIELLPRRSGQNGEPFCKPVALQKEVVGGTTAKPQKKAINPLTVKNVLGDSANEFFQYVSPTTGKAPTTNIEVTSVVRGQRGRDIGVTYTFVPPWNSKVEKGQPVVDFGQEQVDEYSDAEIKLWPSDQRAALRTNQLLKKVELLTRIKAEIEMFEIIKRRVAETQTAADAAAAQAAAANPNPPPDDPSRTLT